jgi:hypothetical protein
LSLWKKPPLGIPEITVALNPGTARKYARDFGYADRRLTQDIALRYRAASHPEHRGESAKVNGVPPEASKKLNVFAWMASSAKPDLSGWAIDQVHQLQKKTPAGAGAFEVNSLNP